MSEITGKLEAGEYRTFTGNGIGRWLRDREVGSYYHTRSKLEGYPENVLPFDAVNAAEALLQRRWADLEGASKPLANLRSVDKNTSK